MAILPAVSVAVVSYFGYYAVWGERGYLALDDRAGPACRRTGPARPAQRSERGRLEHRIALLKPGSPDPDLVEELARTQLMDGAPGQVAVPRTSRNKPTPSVRNRP